MKVILKDYVTGLGKVGEQVNVKDGYARNFLIPRDLAVEATPQAIKLFEQGAEKRAKILAQHMAEHQQVADAISTTPITVYVKTGAEDRLFGSVSASDIANALKEKGIEVDRKKIALHDPLRALGEYAIPIKLHPEITASLKVTVAKEESSETSA